jgi:hypothetical protein
MLINAISALHAYTFFALIAFLKMVNLVIDSLQISGCLSELLVLMAGEAGSQFTLELNKK